MTGIELTVDAAIKAGFKGIGLITAVAIAGAESAFNVNAVGDINLIDNKWGPSVGLWQIRSLKNPAAYTGADLLRVETKLTDPYYNARAAYAISKGGTDFKPWSTYTNGMFTKFTAAAAAAVKKIIETAGNPAVIIIAMAAIAALIFLKL